VSQALYRKYRSKSLADIVGQDHITDILTRALKAGKVAHAYLFTGPRGVGKTSIARILAHEINRLPYDEASQHLDIIEIDAASNNGVEDVRDLREKVQIAPVSAAKKVYIIDEVHMLSKPAFNALLKTLEEPPEHIVFILATTDVEKLPATIVSRTQRYGFRAIHPDSAVAHLRHIAQEEHISISDEALRLIAERGDGSFRDSISLLDQLSSLADEKEGITTQLVETALGLAPARVVDELLAAVEGHDVRLVASTLADVEADGVSPLVITDQLIKTLRTRIQDSPSLLSLLDNLLDVPKSSQPAAKLLTVLGLAASAHKTAKTAALATPVLEVSATIEELSAQATKKHPKAVAPTISAPQMPATTAQPKTPQTTSVPSEPQAAPKPLTPAHDGPLDWPALIEYTREHYVALYSVLSKCGFEISGEALTIYTANAFYKKKLDDPKYRTNLYDSLRATGGHELTIETIPTRAPMKDSQAAAIADIMGGGVEVSPEAA
jgi:DNA polymerase-3 subunit gamma/tau